MTFNHDFKHIIKPILGWMSLFSFLSLIFVAMYVYTDYRGYVSSYKTIHQEELKSVQEKIRTNIENLRKLSILTSSRIGTVHGDIERIQSILNTSHNLLPTSEWHHQIVCGIYIC